jgi:hypothetical protein
MHFHPYLRFAALGVFLLLMACAGGITAWRRRRRRRITR